MIDINDSSPEVECVLIEWMIKRVDHSSDDGLEDLAKLSCFVTEGIEPLNFVQDLLIVYLLAKEGH